MILNMMYLNNCQVLGNDIDWPEYYITRTSLDTSHFTYFYHYFKET